MHQNSTDFYDTDQLVNSGFDYLQKNGNVSEAFLMRHFKISPEKAKEIFLKIKLKQSRYWFKWRRGLLSENE